MGQEALCKATFGEQTSRGKALLETKELLFRGDFRVAVPLQELTRVSADAADLTVAWKGGALTLRFGDVAVAKRWAAKIRNPPGRLDKLGVKEGTRVALVTAKGEFGGDADMADFVAELGARGARLVKGAKTMADADLMFLLVDGKADLKALPKLIATLRPDAAIWTLRPKGSAAVTESDVRNAARAAGLVDVKVASFSETRTAEKFVVPVDKRGKKAAARK
jgi:hypothetical protein